MASDTCLEQDRARLVAQLAWLHLLMVHLVGAGLARRVEREDLVQEALLRALQAPGLPAFEPGEVALRRWLASLARHTVVDVVRAWRARKRRGPEAPLARADWSSTGLGPDELASSWTGPATRAGRAEDHARLLVAFETLGAEHRRVLGLRQFEGLPARAVAARMGRSESAIHSLYRRALGAWHEAAS